MAEMDVFSGNSGSPVYDALTHELLGIVTRGDGRDFHWNGDCVAPTIYPNTRFNSLGARCTKVSEFAGYCCQ